MDKAIVDNYIKFFEHRLQSGGGSVEYPIYHGARFYQNGNGFGDILRGVFRFILPIAASGATTFLGEMMKSRDAGADWKTSARNAISPTATNVLTKAVEQVQKRQVGTGRRRKRKSKQYKKKINKHPRQEKWNV